MKAIIKNIVQETPVIMTFVVEPEKPVTFQTGQAMRWNIPQSKVGRLFSMANAGGKNLKELWFTIRILPDGQLSSFLPQSKVGDEIELNGPFGKFIFDDKNPLDIGLIAGGSGISVLRSILRHVLDNKISRKVHLVFSIKTLKDIVYEHELKTLAERYDNFTYNLVITDNDPDWTGDCGYVSKEIFDKAFGDYKKRFYVCGPHGFINCSVDLLKQAGVPDDRIHIDRWEFYKKEDKK